VTVLKLSWLGVRTDQFGAMGAFVRELLGGGPSSTADGVEVFDLPDGSKIELWDAVNFDWRPMFTTGPVVGLLVDDIDDAVKRAVAAGAETIGELGRAGDAAWQILRGPDGNVYVLKVDPAIVVETVTR
jgi:hypothetical protein